MSRVAVDSRVATRLMFFAAGFAMSCWAPLVPFAKANVGADEARFGLLLLCLGIGSIVAMPLTGWLSTRIGSKPMMLTGGFGMAGLLPLLILAGSWPSLAVALLFFGAALGTTDVAMNVHGAEVERRERQPLMSGFHAWFSVGGIAGAGGVTLLLSLGLTPFGCTLVGSALTLLTVLLSWPGLLRASGGEPLPFVAPHGIVLLLAALAGVMFLVEGAILDWGALLIVELELASLERSGIGYVVFSIAMTLGRFVGDRVTAALGGFRVMVFGGLVLLAGFVLLLTPLPAPVALAGFALIGLGASNIVPVLFSLAGRQTVMPAGLAVAAVTTTGYAGILLGPAAIGFVAEAAGLARAFWMLAVLVAVVPLCARAAARAAPPAGSA